MKSKYGFESAEERVKELEGFLKRQPPTAKKEKPQPRQGGVMDYAPIYQTLEQTATALSRTVADILADFEQSKGHRPGMRAQVQFHTATQLYYWLSQSIGGLYLMWSLQEAKPYLMLLLLPPVDNNDRKLGPILERITGVKVVVQEAKDKEKDTREFPRPFIPIGIDEDEDDPATIARYGPDITRHRKALRELFKRQEGIRGSEPGARAATREADVVEGGAGRSTSTAISKYGFDMEGDDRQALEELFKRQFAPVEPDDIDVKTGLAADIARDEAIYRELDAVSGRIAGVIQDILSDYEKARGELSLASIRHEYNRATRLHSWRSESIKGLYLMWSLEEKRPYLLLALPKPLKRNSKKLPVIISEETQIRVVTQEIDRRRWSDTPDPTSPFPKSKKVSLLTRYGFETLDARRLELEELFRPAPDMPAMHTPGSATRAAAPASGDEQDLRADALIAQLDERAAEIDKEVRNVLKDYEIAQGETKPRVRKGQNEATHLHYWVSNSIAGVYLQWVSGESEPFLTVVLKSYPDTNSRKLGRKLEQATGLEVTTLEAGETQRFGSRGAPTSRSQGVLLD